jgi:hypothetical protein
MTTLFNKYKSKKTSNYVACSLMVRFQSTHHFVSQVALKRCAKKGQIGALKTVILL